MGSAKSQLESNLETRQKPRNILRLPFAENTFDSICSRFQVHKSIARTIARKDVPSFSCERIEMDHPALVYNCRTPNDWANDLALSATYYPQHGLTFAIIYGSSGDIEKAILERLQSINAEAAHPLLLPGIIAELELARHTRLVESSINDIETRISEMKFHPHNARELLRSQIEHRNHLKRESWLDLTYLRNSLSTWSAQLLKMVENAEALSVEDFTTSDDTTIFISKPLPIRPTPERRNEKHRLDFDDEQISAGYVHGAAYTRRTDLSYSEQEVEEPKSTEYYIDDNADDEDKDVYLAQMRKVGGRIKIRLAAIRDDYDEKIRDCTMRVDGMAMATQWSHSETAVEIALATNQDSKVMRSISLVTMVFLPGTFFATVFSMTFFDWFDDEGKTRVSSYLWIYVVVTIVFTAITIGLWYFFVIFRRTGEGKGDEEKARIE
ncbi:hypothetical protein CC86DRAFT_76131 [Ophiobolus disseminans]|uniref:Cora-domain-containing protein n=1 Tax=Ophiobolus disseminans TaxID=1469910 RepID=A0A6A6ZQQ2_9PLEO|nr:hypothetical protein CC86DRAFT_76131 [Ophiobolus disseminans]